MTMIEKQPAAIDSHVPVEVAMPKESPEGLLPRTWKQVTKPAAKWALEKKLSIWFKAAKDKQANGRPKGHKDYHEIRGWCKEAIAEFCQTYGVDQKKLETQISGLDVLEDLCQPTVTPGLFARILFFLLIAFGGVAILAVLFRFFHFVYQF